MKFKHLIEKKNTIDFWSSENFVSMKDIRRKCNLIMDLSKFRSNLKKFSRVVVISYNQVNL